MKLVVLNHKMNLNYDEIKKYIEELKMYKDQLVVIPSAIYAKEFIDSGFKTGLQNTYNQDKGMYTGEISPAQAKSLGIEYVLIGHSERRLYCTETDNLINEKIKRAVNNNLKVILCVGDNLNENVHEVLYYQITKALEDVKSEVIIAYEPVYAIGTGSVPNIDDIQERINYIKSLSNNKILYGGSVNFKNIKALNQLDNLDGYLIGKASLSSQEVIKILEVVS